MIFNFFDTFDPRKNRLVEKYVIAMRLHRMYLERELNKSGVFRSQHQILMHIARFPNASQKEIATRHHVSTATIAVSLKKLEKGGYIRRMTDQADNRYNQICLTDKGQAVVENSIKVFKRLEEALFDDFSEEEMDQFESYLDRVRLNLEHLFQEKEHTAETPEQTPDRGMAEMPEQSPDHGMAETPEQTPDRGMAEMPEQTPDRGMAETPD